jgi:hypothetical protein
MSAGYATQNYPASYAVQQQPYVPSSSTPVQYPVQYSQAQQAYYGTPYQVPHKSQSPPPSPEQPSAPDVNEVTPEVASQSLRKLISFELQGAGFEAAQQQTMERLETELVACE